MQSSRRTPYLSANFHVTELEEARRDLQSLYASIRAVDGVIPAEVTSITTALSTYTTRYTIQPETKVEESVSAIKTERLYQTPGIRPAPTSVQKKEAEKKKMKERREKMKEKKEKKKQKEKERKEKKNKSRNEIREVTKPGRITKPHRSPRAKPSVQLELFGGKHNEMSQHLIEGLSEKRTRRKNPKFAD